MTQLTAHVEGAGPAGGFVFTETKVIKDGDVTFRPWIGPNSEVGYQMTHTDGRIEYLYFNPSTDGGYGGSGDGPGNNVFVYQGITGDPATDGSLHFYHVLERESP